MTTVIILLAMCALRLLLELFARASLLNSLPCSLLKHRSGLDILCTKNTLGPSDLEPLVLRDL